MLNYTDIPSKIEDVQNALDSLYDLIYSQYNNTFQGEDAEKYQRMLQDIQNADRLIDEVDDINNRLSNVFEENLYRLF